MTTERVSLHGPQEPLASTPPLQVGTVRRTSTLDILRPDGLAGRAQIVGRARDVVGDVGGLRVIEECSLHIDVPNYFDPAIAAIEITPPMVDLSALVGASASRGFRARVRELGTVLDGSIVALLLTDVPSSFVVGGFAMQQAGPSIRLDLTRLLVQADVCAGWARTATMMTTIEREGYAPPVIPPPAPPFDAYGWHEFPSLEVHGVRRHRRLDTRRSESGEVTIDAWFRDSYMAPEGEQPAEEQVVHEYSLQADTDDNSCFRRIAVTPRVLPRGECPSAIASAQRLVGAGLAEATALVRREFHGTTTCTHLNSMLVSLGDVPHLLARGEAAS